MQIKLCDSHNVKYINFGGGSQVKVLAPESLVKRIKDELEKTINLYLK